MAVAQCPASCGELIQGWVQGGEKLVSCPVDWYSTVEATAGQPSTGERPLMRAMVKQVLTFAGLPADESRNIRLRVESTIPQAKGMASSTADIAATAVATAAHLGLSLNENNLARLCVGLEPTDSTIFRSMSLFDHLHGQHLSACEGQPAIDFLLLESPLILRTADYHRLPRQTVLREDSEKLDNAWRMLQQACRDNDPGRLGEAATISAIASQKLLPKPGFTSLLNLAEAFDLYGINVAHSGSVVGLMLDRERHDSEKILRVMAAEGLLNAWPRQHLLRMVPGGVTLR